MFGILNVNKPSGMTSRDVVNRVQRIVRPAKAGHAGTLDPLAGGVLVVCVGPATRLIEYVQRMAKRYIATFLLGLSSETDDLEYEPTALPNAPRPTRQEVLAALPAFTGLIQQRPPAHSAIKVQGRRSFELARQGRAVELAERPVTIHSIAMIEYDYPRLTLNVQCGSGTYIRSLGRDLAERLGTVAVMSDLCRTEIGPFRLEEACSLEELTDETALQVHLRSPREALADLPTLVLDESAAARIRSGQFIAAPADLQAAQAVAVDAAARLAAVLERHGDGMLKAAINFPAADGPVV